MTEFAPLNTVASNNRSRKEFNYAEAFSRNIGWVTSWEQQVLRDKRIAIAGLGGVGGNYLVTLARLGIGAFHIADFDHFEYANFNRQSGAAASTIGQSKATVMAARGRDINPDLDLQVFGDGVTEDNIDLFLNDVDLFIDGLDFFVIDIRAKIFARCREKNIPAITAAPAGMGVAWIIFQPDGMSFEDYFRFDRLSDADRQIKFLLGLTPKGLHRKYLIDPYRADFANKRVPSTGMGCDLCAGIVGTEALKILLDRSQVKAAPYFRHFDAYRGKLSEGKLRWGNRGPLQSIRYQLAKKTISDLARHSWPLDPQTGTSDVEQILELARWAPSGDNSQPWRFLVTSQASAILYVDIQGPDQNIYDYNNGEPSWLSTGFLLESIRIAASRFGRNLTWTHQIDEKGAHAITLNLALDVTIEEDVLLPYLSIRSVDRRCYKTTPLTGAQKNALEASLGHDLDVIWFETMPERLKMARLNARATDIRLRLKASWKVHNKILDWKKRFSPDGVPVTAIGLDRLTLTLMRRVLKSWPKTDFMNRYLGGTIIPRIQLDLLPGLSCGAHFTINYKEGSGADDLLRTLRTGMALQRFWLTATQAGLALQPSLAPLCFASHHQTGRANSFNDGLKVRVIRLVSLLRPLAGKATQMPVFLGRIGSPGKPGLPSRSVRRPLTQLLK
jgi:molybdopterin/thiamine biosynthesis adenylyltransferase